MKFEKLESEEDFRVMAAQKVEGRPQMEFITVEGQLVAVRVGKTRITSAKGVGITVHMEIET